MIKILNLFIAMLIVIFVTAYYDRFGSIETFFYYLFYCCIVSLLGLLIVMPIVRANGKDDDNEL